VISAPGLPAPCLMTFVFVRRRGYCPARCRPGSDRSAKSLAVGFVHRHDAAPLVTGNGLTVLIRSSRAGALSERLGRLVIPAAMEQQNIASRDIAVLPVHFF